MAEAGKPVLGICNGFQILIEAGLLPGSLLRNMTLRFVCRWVRVRVENTRTPFTLLARGVDCLWIPIAHNEGRFYASRGETRELSGSGRVVFRYVDDRGIPSRRGNPTGTLENIAGICNKEGNVVGLMPHPERASDTLLSPFNTSDGRLIFSSLSRFGREAGSAG
jgi:phosphoribosylformylglycinamidine synthase